MNRDEAHAAICLILSDIPPGYRLADAADDILDAIEPMIRETWDDGYGEGRDDEAGALPLRAPRAQLIGEWD